MNNRIIITAALTSLLLSGCNLSPKFETPKTDVPASYKEDSGNGPAQEKGVWVPARSMEKADRGAWWNVFGDTKLDELEKQAASNNQDLRAAAARVEEARSLARSESPTYLPDLALGGNATREQLSGASVSSFSPQKVSGPLKPVTLYNAQGSASYEVDLFGRVRSNYRALERDTDAAQATYRSVLLTLQADVAQNYFTLRALDSERKVLRDTVETRDRANAMMKRRFDAGDARTQDYEETRSDLASAQADLAGLDRRRAALEHALAVLLGQMPSTFSFAEAPLTDVPPAIPAGLPSTLLARRPDVAAALSSMAAANERIGVARAAFYPSLNLAALGGFESTSLGDLLTWPMRTWVLGQAAGTALNWTIFDSGRRNATLSQAHAAFDETLANYRQQVLTAFRDVEDNLSDQRLLADQSKAADEAAASATHATELTRKRFDDGDADYFEVVELQRTSLAAERAAVQIRGQRFVTTVGLIRALGGDWPDVAPVAEEPAPKAAPVIVTEPVAKPAVLAPKAVAKPKKAAVKKAPVVKPSPAPAAEPAPAPAAVLSPSSVSEPLDDDPQTPVFPASTSGAISHPEK